MELVRVGRRSFKLSDGGRISANSIFSDPRNELSHLSNVWFFTLCFVFTFLSVQIFRSIIISPILTMSLYHEAAEILSSSSNSSGSLKSRVFGKKNSKAPPGQLYALVLESAKWSPVLKEVIEKTGLLKLERKVI